MQGAEAAAKKERRGARWLGVFVSPKMKKAVRLEAVRREISISDVVRGAIRESLERAKGRES